MKIFSIITMALGVLLLLIGCDKDQIKLTSEEQAWLEAHGNTIILEYDATFPPIEFEEDGKYRGIASDVIHDIEKILAIDIIEKPSSDWANSVQNLISGKTAILGAMVKNTEREKFAFFTDPYLTISAAFISQKGTPKVKELTDLNGKRVAVIDKFIEQAYLIEHTDTSLVKLIPVFNLQEGIEKIVEGEIDYFAGGLATVSWKIMEMGVTNLHVAGELPLPLSLNIAVSKKYPLLYSIMNKAERMISDKRMNEIKQTWIAHGGKRNIPPFIIRLTISILAIIIIFLLIRQYLIYREAEKVTARFGLQLAEVSKQIPDAMVYQVKISPSGERTFLFISDGIEKLHGVKAEAVLADSSILYRQIHTDDIDKLTKKENESLESLEIFRCEARFNHPNGEIRWSLLTSTPRKQSDGSVIWDGVDMDITRFKQLEHELESNRRFTIQAVDSSHELFGWLSPDGILEFTNAKFLNLIDASLDQVVGKLLWKTPLFLSDSDEQRKIKEAIRKAAKGNNIRYDVQYKNENDKIREIDFYVSPIRDSDGEISTLIIEGADVTEEREIIKQKEKLTEQLHQSQKMEAVGQLAGGIAHDFSNALSGIMGAAELLQDEALSKEGKELVSMILTAGENAGDLTKKLLTFSRKGKKVSTAVNLLKIVEQTIELLKHTINKNILIEIDNQAKETSVIGDDSLLQNALMNIGINASQAMPEGGKLSFVMKNIFLNQEYCNNSVFDISSGEFLEIEISDTGIGMSSEIQSHIFEPFFTTKEAGEGTGLGMAAVYGTVQEHRGVITVFSEEGIGTKFHIYIPITKEIVTVKEDFEVITKGSGTILVIDDERIIRVTADAMLRNLGYDVMCDENGLDGINRFKNAQGKIDLVILDMIMPIMGGRETYKKLCEINPKIPVIISSGFSKDNMTFLSEDNIVGFLHKPFRKAELVKLVSKAIPLKA